MKEYKRKHPVFALCGLNCGLCPRYQMSGKSKCHGCGGKDFHIYHPSCAVINCSKRHEGVEYCFMCKDFPCKKYESVSPKDSFITYQNVIADMKKAADFGIDQYLSELNEKISFLEDLIENYNDGRRKNFYCVAVNLLSLQELGEVRKLIEDFDDSIDQRYKIELICKLINDIGIRRGIEIKLRK